ncbi:MAG: Lipid A export ATP-binding/permease protein MsbA [Opitutia bacterium UBA7350]|nr:MAG: Lipid A export ATP-binding/permease protein MsbA [Opitutae bacterium UBA7350]
MPLKRFSPYFAHLKSVRLQFVVGLLAGILAAAASGAGLPLVIEYIVPKVSAEGGPVGLALLATLAIIPGIFAVRALGSFLNAYFMAYAGMHVLECLRLDVFKKIQSLPLGFFQKNGTGDLMARVIGDTQKLQAALVQVVNSLIKEPATLISAAGAIIYLSMKYENGIIIIVALASVPVCVLPIKYIGKRLIQKAHAAQKQAGLLNDVLNENLQAVREVRAYNLQQRESNRFKQACRDFFKFTLKTVKYNKALTPLIEVVAAVAIAFSLCLIIDKVEASAIAAILTALYMSYEPVKKLGVVSNTLREAEASLDRLEYVLHSNDDVPEPATPRSLPAIRGEIQFQEVHFSYDPDIPVLAGINITIQAGENIALVGPSGAGKSTFANLVPRFYDATSGSILLDGIDLRQLIKHDLREQIALVSQEALLFSDTIANNIRIGNPTADQDAVRKAARLAYAHDFIETLDDGYETLVGERGSRLSGGQRQRIAIARAFLKDAPIIVLDEPTSALDAESEHQIQAALDTLTEGRTVITIAHRFSTIQHASRILVFDAGQIVASGNHQELYASSELYRNLYDKQSKTTQST